MFLLGNKKPSVPAIPINETFSSKNDVNLFVTPFHKDNVDSVKIEIGRPMFGEKGDLEFKGTIHFMNSGSSGYKYLKGDNLQDVIDKINLFLKSI